MGQAVDVRQDLPSFMFPERPVEVDALAMAGAMKRIRNRREQAFPGLKFSDPVWNMLLDLFVEEARGREVSVTSLCIAAGVPTSTAIRCIRAMVREGALTKSKDGDDGRRIFVELSDGSRMQMRSLLTASTPQISDISQVLAR